jgi:hypothetical protein
MEITGLEPANADNNALADAGEVDSNPAETSGADPAPAADDSGKPSRDRVQERIDALTREKYQGLSRAELAEYRAQQLEQRLAQLEAQSAKPQTVAPSDDEYPTLESVGWDDAKHQAAVAAWGAKQAREAAKAELAAEREAARRTESETNWKRKEAEFVKSKPDYSEKVLRSPAMGGPVITDQMAQVIQESDIGPEVAYYLAENVQKSVEIARLPAYLQAREIGRIEERLAVAKASPPPVSKAPSPVAKIETDGSVAPLDLGSPESNTLSADEWNRRMELKERRKRSKT